MNNDRTETINMTVGSTNESIDFEIVNGQSTSNYERLENKPKINGHTLIGNLTAEELDIDQDFVKDDNYVHTDNNYTTEEKTKLASLENYDDTEVKQDISNLQTNKANASDIPTDLKDLNDDSTHRLVTDTEKTSWNNKADVNDIPDVSSFITRNVNNLTNYTLKTSTGSLIDLEINQSTYVITLSLKDIDGNVISTDTIDLPLENVVVNGSFDNVNKKIVLTLENGNTVDIPVGDLIAGLQTEITSSNKLSSDLVDDSNSGNKFVTTSEKQVWNNKYDKPAGGIPKTDLSSDVQTSLGKADSALQEHQDLSNYVKNTDIAGEDKAGIIAMSSYFGTQKAPNGNYLYGVSKDYAMYQILQNPLLISKGTLENVITGKGLTTKSYVDGLVGDISSALDTINGEVVGD